MCPKSIQQFYDQLSSVYHLIFADWRSSVQWHGEILDTIIRKKLGSTHLKVLDCSCGIGTQAIGLALCGYEVHGTDISPAAIERAKIEANSFGVIASFGVADLRSLDRQVSDSFDVVISCDNSLPHLLTDNDLLMAAKNIRTKLESNGLFIASVRDYDQILTDRPKSTLPQVFDDTEGRRVVFQLWDWSEDGRNYVFHLFILTESQGKWRIFQYTTQYRALLRHELGEILTSAGFSDIGWQMPSESGYYQPVVTAHK